MSFRLESFRRPRLDSFQSLEFSATYILGRMGLQEVVAFLGEQYPGEFSFETAVHGDKEHRIYHADLFVGILPGGAGGKMRGIHIDLADRQRNNEANVYYSKANRNGGFLWVPVMEPHFTLEGKLIAGRIAADPVQYQPGKTCNIVPQASFS